VNRSGSPAAATASAGSTPTRSVTRSARAASGCAPGVVVTTGQARELGKAPRGADFRAGRLKLTARRCRGVGVGEHRDKRAVGLEDLIKTTRDIRSDPLGPGFQLTQVTLAEMAPAAPSQLKTSPEPHADCAAWLWPAYPRCLECHSCWSQSPRLFNSIGRVGGRRVRRKHCSQLIV
jgi:hypothetical protein